MGWDDLGFTFLYIYALCPVIAPNEGEVDNNEEED